MSRSCYRTACATVLAALAAACLFAEDKPATTAREPAASSGNPLATGEATIEKALQQPTDFVFNKTPLSDVVAYIKKRHSIEVVLDVKGLENVDMNDKTPITLDVHGVTLRCALDLLSHLNCDITALVKDGVLLITTPDVAQSERCLVTKVYDVADLVVCRDSHGVLWDDYEPLIEAISSIGPQSSWSEYGGLGTVSEASLGTAKVLVITQTYHVHCRIPELLARIREIAKKNPNAGPPLRDRPPVKAKQTLRAFASQAGASSSPQQDQPKTTTPKEKPAKPAEKP